MSEGFRPDDDPTPIVPVPDIGPDLARCRRQRARRLLALWASVVVLLGLQVAVAMHLRGQRRARLDQQRAVAAPASRPATAAAAAPASRPLAATLPSTRETAASQAAAEPVEPRPARARRGTKKKTARKKAQTEQPVAKTAPLRMPKGPLDDVTVPPGLVGDPGQGERLFRMGCGLCHGRTAPAVSAKRFSIKQWSTYFARGAHARHAKLGSHFTRSELADVKAYLRSIVEGR